MYEHANVFATPVILIGGQAVVGFDRVRLQQYLHLG